MDPVFSETSSDSLWCDRYPLEFENDDCYEYENFRSTSTTTMTSEPDTCCSNYSSTGVKTKDSPYSIATAYIAIQFPLYRVRHVAESTIHPRTVDTPRLPTRKTKDCATQTDAFFYTSPSNSNHKTTCGERRTTIMGTYQGSANQSTTTSRNKMIDTKSDETDDPIETEEQAKIQTQTPDIQQQQQQKKQQQQQKPRTKGKRQMRYSKRVTCHHCGNMRSELWTCPHTDCTQSFCKHCTARIMEQWNQKSMFSSDGCPTCLGYCCCRGIDARQRETSSCPLWWSQENAGRTYMHCIRCRNKFVKASHEPIHKNQRTGKAVTRRGGIKRSRPPNESENASSFHREKKSPLLDKREPYCSWVHKLFQNNVGANNCA